MILGNKQRILISKLPLELLNLLLKPAILLGHQETILLLLHWHELLFILLLELRLNVVIGVLMRQPRRSERHSGGIGRGLKPLCSFQFCSQYLDGVVLFSQLEPLLLQHQVLLLISHL